MSKNLDRAIELVRKMDLMTVRKEFKTEPLDVVGSLLRSVFIAKPGHKFVICDLSAIENRGLGYVAEDETILEVFRKGLDPYLNFATKMYQVPYESLAKIVNREHKPIDAEAKEKRQNAKPAVLGCVSEGTPVLTDGGWLAIDKISSEKVFDDLTFVKTSGILFKGYKEVTPIGLTPDHKVLIKDESWEEACRIQSGRTGQQATSLASGRLLSSLEGALETCGIMSASVLAAGLSNRCMPVIWNLEKPSPVSSALTRESYKNSGVFIYGLKRYRETLLIGSLIAITQSVLDVGGLGLRGIGTPEEVLLAHSLMCTLLSVMLFPSQDMTIALSNWTESITTGITNKATCDSLRPKLITIIKRYTDSWNGAEKLCRQQISGEGIAPDTGTEGQLSESYGTGLAQKESFQTKESAKANTYDVLNAGPKNRFLILTPKGPLVVHNCGYMLSGGEEIVTDEGDKIFTGLMGYGRAMGIPLTKELADLSVQVFRDTHVGVVKCWRRLEDSAMMCIRTGRPQVVGPVRFEMTNGVLRMILPSGRSLHYLEPKIVEREWFGGKKKTIECWGIDQKKHIWTRIYTYGGKLIENAVQAISRDILVDGMFNATATGFPIVMHCHDEIVAEVPEESPLGIAQLRECMIRMPKWGNHQLLIDAAGFESKVYKKE